MTVPLRSSYVRSDDAVMTLHGRFVSDPVHSIDHCGQPSSAMRLRLVTPARHRRPSRWRAKSTNTARIINVHVVGESVLPLSIGDEVTITIPAALAEAAVAPSSLTRIQVLHVPAELIQRQAISTSS